MKRLRSSSGRTRCVCAVANAVYLECVLSKSELQGLTLGAQFVGVAAAYFC